MQYQALYRKWRPLTFDDVVGQEHISQTLKNEIVNDRIAHAYLFCGTRGTGKTSSAKIFARALNCTSPQNGNPCNVCDTCVGILAGSISDVYEMDAASNNGVDNIREIRDEVAYTPTHGKYKIYIIDEAHMLSSGAFNALLKTLEEPPAHVIFVLATTEPHKLPATILSRCQRFDFRRITINDISARLLKISEAEGINITPDAAEAIAAIGDGSMRDAVSALDRCSAHGLEQIRAADVAAILGIADKSSLFDIAESVAGNDVHGALVEVGRLTDSGAEVLSLFEDLISHYRNLLVCKASGGDAISAAALIDKTVDVAEKYQTQAAKYTNGKIIDNITVLSEYVLTAKWMSQPKVAIEMAIVRMCGEITGEVVVAPKIAEKPAASSVASGAKPALADSALDDNVPWKNEELVPNTEHAPPPVAEATPMPEPPPVEPESSANIEIEQSFESPPVAASSSGDIWADALAEIKGKSMQLYGFLASAKVDISDGFVKIQLNNSVAAERVGRPEGIKYLEELLSRVAGDPISVEIAAAGSVVSADFQQQNDGVEELAGLQQHFGDIMEVE